jgi:hypothetical protein
MSETQINTAVLLCFGAIFVWFYFKLKRDKANSEEQRAKDAVLAAQVWHLSPLNPDGPNYDPAAYAAWQVSPDNPDNQ